jgi:uncharacterized protein (TIGR03067 family)
VVLIVDLSVEAETLGNRRNPDRGRKYCRALQSLAAALENQPENLWTAALAGNRLDRNTGVPATHPATRRGFPMRKVIGLALLAASLTMPVWADDKPTTEDEKLVGTWVFTSAIMKGKEVPVEGAYIFSKDGNVVMKKKDTPNLEGMYKTAAARDGKDFREIDLIGSKDGKPVDTAKAIYRIEGDTLTMAFPTGGNKERPTSLDPKEWGVLILKRQKP